MSNESRRQVAEAVRAVEEKKGDDLAILEMEKGSGAFTDYFVVCSGSNPRQIQAIANEVEDRLARAGVRPASIEGLKQAEWVLLDYVDFVVHIFSERARKFYDLERLWKTARRLTPADLAKKPPAKAPEKKPVKAKAAKKTVIAPPGKTGARAKNALAKRARPGRRAKTKATRTKKTRGGR